MACGGGSWSLFAGCKYHKPPVPTIVFLDLRQTQPWPSESKQVKTGARQWGSIKSRKAIKVGERCVRPGRLSRMGKQDGWKVGGGEMQGECERWGWWGRERERVSAGAQWPCPASLMCGDPCALVSVRSCWGSWSLSVISNAVISSEWQSCLPVASCHPKHATSSPAPTWKAKARLLGLGGGSNVTAQINLHRPGAWWTNVQLYCMFAFEPELKKHLLDYLHESPALWYFQEPCCLFSSLSQGNGSLRFHDTPVERGAL